MIVIEDRCLESPVWSFCGIPELIKVCTYGKILFEEGEIFGISSI